MWGAAIIFLVGVTYRAIQLFTLTRKKEKMLCPTGAIRKDTPEEKKMKTLISFKNSLIGKNPIMAIVSFVFHFCLFAAPLFALGHSLVLYESWGISFVSLPDPLIDVLTIVFLLCSLFFLIRRIVIPRVSALSTPYDYLLLFITAAPFLTGLFAYHQWFDYKTVITLHLLAGQLMLVVIPFTKLGHMVFFFFVRILLGGEFSFGKGNRIWST
jgi:nitrate reductase gamma subunit